MVDLRLIIELNSIDDDAMALVGSKAMGLARLRRMRLAVPEAFCVTTAAFSDHVPAGWGSGVDDDGAREEVRDRILGIELSAELQSQIASHYERLGGGAVAVRSSATAEDLPDHSFAGQYDTFLGVNDLESCIQAVRKCWAALWTPRAYEYRQRQGFEHGKVQMAVIVQKRIDPDAAGVVFTIDPVTGSRSRIVIEACEGLGEKLVSGHVEPERIILRKKNLSLIRQQTPVRDDGGCILSPKLAKRVARLARRIERELTGPQDIEWAVRGGKVWLLQVRPITAIPPQRSWEDRQIWSNINLGEVMPDVLTPVTWSMIEPTLGSLFGSIVRFMGSDLSRAPLAGLVAGRLYFSLNVGLAVARPFGGTFDETGEGIVAAIGGDPTSSFESSGVDPCDEDLPDLGFSWPRYILSWPGLLWNLFAHRPSKGAKFQVELRRRVDALAALDVEAMTTEDLVKTMDTALGETIGACDLLYLIVYGPGVHALDWTCRKWLGDHAKTLVYRLFNAQGGMSDTQAGLELWSLAVLAREDESTLTTVSSDEDWSIVAQKLDQTSHGQTFLKAWDAFMKEHGHHCRGELELVNPRWRETPDYILDLVRGYLRAADQVDPIENHKRLAQERQVLTQQCRERLKNPIKRALFNWGLKSSQQVTIHRENWKDLVVRAIASLRRILLVLGARLESQGALERRDDIFFLAIPEIGPVAEGKVDFNVRNRIAERRAEYERNQSLHPPTVVVGRFDPSKHVPPPVDTTVEVLNGTAVSPGIVKGKARVILRADDRQQVEAGEILIAPFTDPAWTPYFLPAAGIVMDQGGVLSHGAIIAREYGIPAVVNVGFATRIIKTGQTIQVDGDRGVVTILR